MIHFVTPYREDRNLGKGYNEAMQLIGEDDWLCITDYDVLFLLPDTIKNIMQYPLKFPDGDVFVCYANRTHISNAQLFEGKINDCDQISKHIEIAKRIQEEGISVTKIEQNISGFLMLISKKTWHEIKFTEDLKCLGVDTWFSKCLLQAKKTIYRMNNIYVFHIYRLDKGINNKSHLE